jgi:hypothetical protein
MKSRRTAFDFIAAFLILALPYVEFAVTNRFNLEVVNAVMIGAFAGLALVVSLLMNTFPNRHFRSAIWTALVFLFLDARVDIFQFIGFKALLTIPVLYVTVWLLHARATTILTAVFGGIFAGIAFLPAFPLTETFPETATAENHRTENLPTYVHIILDEQTGLETLDQETEIYRNYVQSAKDVFSANGFRLFGRAYSEYIDTYDSLSAAFNSYRGPQPFRFYNRDNIVNSYSLDRNEYLNNLHELGYDIQIYQTSFVNYCNQSREIIRKCLTYTAFGISSEALVSLTTVEKLDLITSMFGYFYANGIVHEVYQRLVSFAARVGSPIPEWEIVPASDLGPIPVLPVFDQLVSDVIDAPRSGTMFLAHLLIPHHPYSVDDGCEIRRPVGDWKKPHLERDAADGAVNTAESRAERYAEYIGQASCALTKIEQLIEAMKSAGKFENAIIIIHSDHGSRIERVRPRLPNKDRLSRQDYHDGYSILFAVKAPHVAPAYDLRMLPLEQLLRFAQSGEQELLKEPDEHFVYLREDPTEGHDFLKVPMPEIPRGLLNEMGANDQ